MGLDGGDGGFQAEHVALPFGNERDSARATLSIALTRYRN